MQFNFVLILSCQIKVMSEQLKLANQVCFPIYSLAKEIVSRYRPFLEELDLTYPQYLVLLVLWEQDNLTVSKIGEHLNLDSGTLTPLLKRLEQKNIISRRRSSEDERIVNITLTEEGVKLKEKATSVPQKLSSSMNVSKEELIELKRIIENLLLNIK